MTKPGSKLIDVGSEYEIITQGVGICKYLKRISVKMGQAFTGPNPKVAQMILD